MAVYLIIYLVLAVLALSVRKSREGPVLLAVLLFLFWFMGWRSYVGCDFTGYLSRYDNIPSWASVSDALLQREAGFQLVITLVKVSGLSFLWLNVIASAIILLGYYRYFRVSQQPLTEIALFFPVIILQLSMSGIRQGIAVALVTAACAEFIKGRRIATGLWILLAAQFHSSAAVFLPLALLAGRSLSIVKLMVAVAVLTPLSVYAMGERLDDYTDQYVRQVYGDVDSSGAFLRYLLALAPALFFLRFKTRFSKVMPHWRSLFETFSLAIIFTAPVFLASSLAVHRITFYLMPVSIMIAANSYKAFNAKDSRRLLRIAPLLLYGAYIVSWFSFSTHAAICYLPYDSYSF